MIVSGAKKEEYRDIKPYYTSRFRRFKTEEEMKIRLRNGYSRNSPSVVVACRLRKGTGLSEWGATPGKEYYILEILQVGSEN